MSKIGKALLSTAMIAATAATFASTTYAFVVLEDNVHVDNIDFDIVTNEGLLISIDPDVYVDEKGKDVGVTDLNDLKKGTLKSKNFYQDLSAEMISSYLGEPNYQGVTMKAGAVRNNYTDSSKVPGFSKITSGVSFDNLANLVFEKDTVADNPIDPYTSTHVFETATAKTDYVKLDLTFRLAHQGEISGDYKLSFSNTIIESKKNESHSADDVVLLNSLYTVDECSNRSKDEGFSEYTNVQKREWKTGETIQVDPRDALRIAVVNRDVFASELKLAGEGDINKSLTVYEPNTGLGSSAIEGFEIGENDGPSPESPKFGKHDKNFNAMYTYHNNVHPFEKFTAAATAHTGFLTKEVDFGALDNVEIATFSAGEGADKDLASYTDLHLSLYLYLEGWDADFFTGISNLSSDFVVKLGFNIQQA